MRTILSTASEASQFTPFTNVAREAEALLSEVETVVKNMYSELNNGNNQSTIKELMIVNGGAKNLFSNLQNTQSNLMQILNTMIQNNPSITNIDERELKKLGSSLPLLNRDLWAKDDQPAQFEELSLHTAKRKLLKIQNNIIQTKAIYYRFLNEKMNNKELYYDKFEVLANSKKDYIILGETYTSEISLGTSSSQAKFSVSANGKALPIKNGKAIYNTIPKKVGEHKYSAKISVRNPLTGETETFTKDFFFELGDRPYIAVSADNMNILT